MHKTVQTLMHKAEFHLGLHCLPKYLSFGIQNKRLKQCLRVTQCAYMSATMFYLLTMSHQVVQLVLPGMHKLAKLSTCLSIIAAQVISFPKIKLIPSGLNRCLLDPTFICKL